VPASSFFSFPPPHATISANRGSVRYIFFTGTIFNEGLKLLIYS
jgi:hypothetical protein